MFDVLGSLGGLNGAVVVDLFAGSGALGIEALSRGASSVTFVDQDQKVSKVIKDNLVAVKLADHGKVEVVVSDAIAYCRTRATLDSEPIDITFCDPPYSYNNWPKLLGIVPGSLLVLESSTTIELPPHLDLHRVYKYGGTLVTVAQRRRDHDESAVASQDQENDNR